MESIYPELALCGSKNESARTDIALHHLSEVSKGTVSLTQGKITQYDYIWYYTLLLDYIWKV